MRARLPQQHRFVPAAPSALDAPRQTGPDPFPPATSPLVAPSCGKPNRPQSPGRTGRTPRPTGPAASISAACRHSCGWRCSTCCNAAEMISRQSTPRDSAGSRAVLDPEHGTVVAGSFGAAVAGGVPPATRQRPPTARVAHLRAPPDRGPAYGHGWDVEYPRDVWRLRSLGINDGPVATLKFDRITQPWLKDLAKRWIRARLAGGISSSHAYSATAASPASRSSCPPSRVSHPPRHRPQPRGTLPGLPAHGRARCPGPHHAHRSAEHLPADDPPQRLGRRALSPTAMVFSDDFPKPPELAPRSLPETSWRKSKTPPTWTASKTRTGG